MLQLTSVTQECGHERACLSMTVQNEQRGSKREQNAEENAGKCVSSCVGLNKKLTQNDEDASDVASAVKLC